MHVLFVHQNFPAQFRYIAPRLVKDYGWRCTFVTERKQDELPGIEKIVYTARGGASMANSILTRNYENAVAHAHGVFEAMKARPDIQPDLVIAHTGFGSSLFLPFLYDAPVINFLEFYYHPVGQDLGFRKEVPVDEMAILRSRTNNAMILLDLAHCDRGWTPTKYQREFFPMELRGKIDVIFDGIDTAVYHRKLDARQRLLENLKIAPNQPIVTYVARGFEMMRGFDIFMKAAKRIYEMVPDVAIVVVGTDRVHYGGDLKYIQEKSFRHHVMKEDNYDLTKFRFTGYVPQETLADILSLGDVHIYLTEPFIASWSMVDAMACGAVVLASDQTCVREYISPGQNGLLVDFFDDQALAKQAVEVLRDPPAYRHLAEAAMRTVTENYSLDVAMPRLKELYERVASRKREPSVRLEKLVQVGTLKQRSPDLDVVGGTPERPAQPGAGAAQTSEPASAAEVGAGDAPVTGGAQVSGDSLPPIEQAVAQIKAVAAVGKTIPQWISFAQSFRAAEPLGEIGPKGHPQDFARLMMRLAQWHADTVVEIGAEDGGTMFLFSRVASDNAKLICAGLPDRHIPPERIALIEAMARAQQSVICVNADGSEALERKIDKACGGKKLDFLFLHGRRPYKALQSDFRRYRSRVRPGGLIAWDGLNPVSGKTDNTDGADRLWAEVRPLYPQRAEYLNGCTTEFGGIAVVKL